MQGNAVAYLFNGSHPGLSDSPLLTFTAAMLKAIGIVDPHGEMYTQLRFGIPLLSDFAGQTKSVSYSPRGSSHQTAYDMNIYKYVIWEWADSLCDNWSSIIPESGMDVFLRNSCECITLSCVNQSIRDMTCSPSSYQLEVESLVS